MKAIINGIEVTGTPKEIIEYKQLEAQAEAEAFKTLMKDFNPQVGTSSADALNRIINNKVWSLT